MRRQILKLILLVFIAVILLSSNSFAATSYSQSTSSHNEGSSSAGSSLCKSQEIYNQALTLNNTKVKFTQNDTEYIFDISADGSVKFFRNIDFCKPNYSDIPQPVLYKSENFGDGMVIEEYNRTPFVDYYGDIYANSSLKIKNKEIEYLYTSAYVNPSTINYGDNIKRSNGDKFYIPNSARVAALSSTYNYRYASSYPAGFENNGLDDVRIISNSSDKSFTTIMFDKDDNGEQEYIDTVDMTFSVKIAIDKTSIDDYRYICFICNEVGFVNTWQKTGSYLSYGYSLSSNTIDLKNFITCNHDWSVTESDVANHTIKCANCDWEKAEAHNYKFEYDGIANDVCICSRVKQVKYHYDINDDYNTNVEKLMNINSTCDKVEYKKKTGYNFKWYEKYELQFDGSNLFNMTTDTINATKVFLNNATAIDSTTGSRSIFYKAVYSPIKYVFNYSSKASTKDYISKHLNKTISPQTFYYNSKDYLKDNSEYDYLKFKGWTLTEGSDKVDFLSKAEILNYTSIDLSEFTIYPIYEPMEYKILYNTIDGKYDGDIQQVSKTYDYYIDEDFLKPKDMGKNKTFSHYVDMKGNEFTDMNSLRNLIKDEASDGQTIILFAMSKTIDGSVDNGDDSENTTPQNYWDLNNNDDKKDDVNNDNTSGNGNNAGDNGRNDNSSNNNGNLDDGTENSTNDKNDTNSNNASNDGNNSSNNSSINDDDNKSSTNESDNTSNVVDTSNSNNSSTSSYKYYSSSSSGGGGSNSGSVKVKSFPEDKYTGPGVVNELSNNLNGEAQTNTYLNNNSLYLYNNTLETKNVIKSNKDENKSKENKKDKENDDNELDSEVFGPPLIDFETKINYRGIHGPWYYEKEYVDKILRKREEKLKEIEKEKELDLKEQENNSKLILIAIFGSLFVLLIIVFEIFNIIQMRKKE